MILGYPQGHLSLSRFATPGLFEEAWRGTGKAPIPLHSEHMACPKAAPILADSSCGAWGLLWKVRSPKP